MDIQINLLVFFFLNYYGNLGFYLFYFGEKRAKLFITVHIILAIAKQVNGKMQQIYNRKKSQKKKNPAIKTNDDTPHQSASQLVSQPASQHLSLFQRWCGLLCVGGKTCPKFIKRTINIFQFNFEFEYDFGMKCRNKTKQIVY